MGKTRAKDLMMLSVEKATQIYLATLATEGKSKSYIDWLASRLKKFNNFLVETGRENCRLQELTVDDGREYIAFLMGKNERYSDHPNHKETKGKLTIYYINGLGRALRSFSSWGLRGRLPGRNVMQRLKLPKLPNTYPVILTETEIEKVLSACLERLRNFSIIKLFMDTGKKLSELTGLKLSRVDFAVGEMTVFGKGSKERKVPIGLQAKKALYDICQMSVPSL